MTDIQPNDSTWVQEFRKKMPVVNAWAYFDHAAVAPITVPTLEILKRWCDDTLVNGGINWSLWRKELETTRRLAAQLLDAAADEIAFVRNTTHGINIVAEGFPWKPGDNVVTLDNEFPSNLYPWMNLAGRGVEARLVSGWSQNPDPARIVAACDGRTRIVSVSWVGYASGWRIELGALAERVHRLGALFFVDAIQGLGAFPLSVRATDIDFLAADGHKWLLGPEGAGLFFLKRAHLNLLQPTGVGWNSVTHAGNFSNTALAIKPSAGRYEGGSYNMGSLAALAGSIDTLLSFGMERIGARIVEITDLVCERLKSIGAEIVTVREGNHRSGIVSFRLPGRDPIAVRESCRQEAVIVNCRDGCVRVSPHAYVNETDVARLIDALVRCR